MSLSSFLSSGAKSLFFFLESPLAIALKVPCNAFATSLPERFAALTEITSLSLPYSNLTALPKSLGLLFPSFFPFLPLLIILPLLIASFTSLVELDISHNPLGDSSVPLLVSIIKASRTLKTLR